MIRLLPEVPKVDVCLLNSNSSSPEANRELDKLRVALNICGYFQAINHELETSFLDELYDVTKRFFALPREEKQTHSRPGPAAADFDAFCSDHILVENQTLNWDDRLCLNLYPSDQRLVKSWPENPKDFRKILHGYSRKLQKLNEIVLKAMARSLSLEENCFLNQYGESPTFLARFSSYHPFPSFQQLIHGLGADASALTFFIQDKEADAFDVQIDDQWFRVPLVRHAILVKVGDQAEIMSNGIFKSRMHRFVASSGQELISHSVFCNPDNRIEIEPVEGLVDEKRPRLYKKVVDYPGAFFQEHRHEGKRLIDALKI